MKINSKFLSIAAIAIVFIGSGFYLLEENTQKEPATTAKENLVPVRMLDGPNTVHPWEIVKKITGRSIPDEEGIKIEGITSVPTGGGVVSVQALIANNIDYSGGSTSIWINAIAGGAKIKVVRGSQKIRSKEYPGGYWVVLENSSIYTAKDFVGKKVSVNTIGASAEYINRVYLKNNGISSDQVQLVTVPYQLQEQALRSKQVDVNAWIEEKNFQIMKARGGIRVITTGYEILGKSIKEAGGGFREDFIKEHPETVRKFVFVYEKSNRLIYDEFQKNPDLVRKAVAEILKEKDGKVEEANYYIPEFVPDRPFLTDEDSQWWIDRLVEDGKLKEGQIKPSDVYTNEFNSYYKK